MALQGDTIRGLDVKVRELEAELALTRALLRAARGR